MTINKIPGVIIQKSKNNDLREVKKILYTLIKYINIFDSNESENERLNSMQNISQIIRNLPEYILQPIITKAFQNQECHQIIDELYYAMGNSGQTLFLSKLEQGMIDPINRYSIIKIENSILKIQNKVFNDYCKIIAKEISKIS